MLKRTIHVGTNTHIALRDEQIMFRNRDDGTERSVPSEDVGYLEVDTLQATVTSSALAHLAGIGATVAFCDQKHHPVGLLLPLEGNTVHAERFRVQIECSQGRKRRLWKQIVQMKIYNQACLLDALGLSSAAVQRRISLVRSGDSTNQEGVVARYYWRELLRPFGVGRDPEGMPPNNYLNYGYAVVRACVSRALVASGLHPALGVMHSNKYNSFALADDLMEPYRPFVDSVVINLALQRDDGMVLDKEAKQSILSLLTVDAHFKSGRRPLLNAISLSASSLVKAYASDGVKLRLPRLCE